MGLRKSLVLLVFIIYTAQLVHTEIDSLSPYSRQITLSPGEMPPELAAAELMDSENIVSTLCESEMVCVQYFL